jgi:hypothetical protein
MNIAANIQNIVVGIMALVGFILATEKVITWIFTKFNMFRKQANKVEEMENTLVTNTEDIGFLKNQTCLVLEGIRNILRRQLKDDALIYIERGEITHDELQEYEVTYNIYKNMGGNGIGSKYHDEVLKLKVKVIEQK